MKTLAFVWASFLLVPFALAESGAVVFGSFTEAKYAHAAIQKVKVELGVQTSRVAVIVNQQKYLRVMSPLMDEPAARALVQRAKGIGIVGPWFLSAERLAAQLATPSAIRTTPPATPARPVPTGRPQQAERAENPSSAPLQPTQRENMGDPEGRPAARIPTARTNDAQPVSTARPTTTMFTAPTLTTHPDKVVVNNDDTPSIRIDGRVDEPIWAQLPAYDNMLVAEPDTLATPQYATFTRFLYTDKGLYVSAVMIQPRESLVRRLSNRDDELNRDTFGVALDTSGEGLYGYWFELALGGSKSDGKMAPERNITRQWDGAWQGETTVTEEGWSAEFYIPWSIMSMPSSADKRQLTFWVQRKVAHANQQYAWPALPSSGARFMSALQPMEVGTVNPRQQWEVFPYVSSTLDEITSETETRAGVDIFWRPSSNFQLTATANPDFGAVESDDVVVNLTAFETFFPEKRLFFLEGTEVFVTSPRSNPRFFSSRSQGGRSAPSTFTIEPTTLLNTRRIGGAANHVEIPDDVTVSGIEQSKPSELTGAVKLVGQNGGLRYGVLAAQEKEVELEGINNLTGTDLTIREDGRDFGIARILYESSRGGGRKSIGWMGTIASYPNQDDAIVQGIDTHYLSKNGKWAWDVQLVASDANDEMGYGMWSDLSWNPKRGSTHKLTIDTFDDTLDISDLGFLRRNDTTLARYTYFNTRSQNLPASMQRWSRGLFAGAGANGEGDLGRSYVGHYNALTFSNNSEFRADLNWIPAHYDDRNARGNGTYKTENGYVGVLSYGTDSSRKFSTSLQIGVRTEDTGDPSLLADWGFTWNPIDRFTLDMDLRWKKRNNWVIWVEDRDLTAFDAIELTPSMSMDFFITAKQQLRMTLQWAGINADESEFYSVPLQPGELLERTKDPLSPSDDFTISRLTAQLRYRWEIGPLSDLFVVYTRGSNLANRIDEDFDVLLQDAFDDPIIDTLIVKLRYRFGS